MSELRPQVWCANCGFIFPLLVLVALFGTGLLPPQSPNDSAEQIAGWLQDDNTLKLAGFVGATVGLGLLMPLTVAITIQMLRIEGRKSPAMTLLQLSGGLFTWVLTIVPMIIMCVAAYRPGRDPQVTQGLVDLGWIVFFMGLAPFAAQDIAIAVAIFRDRVNAVYPRWVAYFNLWVAVLFVPAVLIPFFKVGPFTYRGLLAFWVPTLVYGLWAMLMAFMTRRAILAQAVADRQPTAVGVGDPVVA